jgi:soluble epoxide hydrolase/lipid-phosphate phosphatase
VSALALIDVGYVAPGTDLNQTYIDTFNNATDAGLGYPIFGYWYFFNEPDAHVLIEANVC